MNRRCRIRVGRPLLGLLVALLLALCPWRADAEPLTWSFALEPGHAARIQLLDEQGLELATFLTADDTQRNQAGWRPDLEPAQGRVSGSIELWLSPGSYTVREILPGGERERQLNAATVGGRMFPATLLPGASGVMAWRRDRAGGNDAFAWAPSFPGAITFLTVGQGEWRAQLLGIPSSREDIGPGTTHLGFHAGAPPGGGLTRTHRSGGEYAWMVRLGLAPITLLFLVLGGLGVWRARRMRGLLLGAGVSLAVGLLAIAPALPRLGSVLLQKDLGHTDPPDSVAQIAAVAQSLPRLSDISWVYDFPEGASWVVTGPSWIGYLLPSVLSWIAGPVVAHNLGIGLHIALLALAAWALARALGAGPKAALLAGISPCFLARMADEIHRLSIDRSTLFLIPIFFLCLHKAAEDRGWRWPVAAGAALAAVFYGQLYYGLYLCAACPLLVLPRLVGPLPLRRLGRMALVGVVAVGLMGPGLYLLVEGTAGTPYHEDEASLADAVDDLWRPVDADQVEQFIRHHGPEHAPGAQAPMGTATDRLLTAVTRSLTLPGFLQPSMLMPGHRHFFLLIGLSVLLARRRRLALVAGLDVAILLVFAMGPLLRTGPFEVAFPLPYYLDFLFVPGFEQLKQLNRFVMMALAISAVPMALGLHGAGSRIAERWSWSRGRVAGVAAVLLTCALAMALALVELRFKELRSLERDSDAHRFFQTYWLSPEIQPIPARPALEAVQGAAVLALPLDHPIPAELSVSAMSAGLMLVNEAPFGSSMNRSSPYWFETNALLNEALHRSGSSRAGSILPLTDPQAALRDLRAGGLQGVVLYRDLLVGPELAGPTEALLDAHLLRVAEDEHTVVWRVPDAP